MHTVVLLIIILLIALLVFRQYTYGCYPREKYAGQTFASRAGGIAGPAPNYPEYATNCVGCYSSEEVRTSPYTNSDNLEEYGCC